MLEMKVYNVIRVPSLIKWVNTVRVKNRSQCNSFTYNAIRMNSERKY